MATKLEIAKALKEMETERAGRSESNIPLAEKYWKLVEIYKKLANE